MFILNSAFFLSCSANFSHPIHCRKNVAACRNSSLKSIESVDSISNVNGVAPCFFVVYGLLGLERTIKSVQEFNPLFNANPLLS